MWHDWRGRKSGFLNLDLHAHLSQRWFAMIRLWMVDWLVAQMANRTICVGPGMMMRDAAQDHHEHQQRKQRYWNGKIPNWTAFMHVTKVAATPNPNHIRRWLSGVNGLRWARRNPSRHSRKRSASRSQRFSAG
jgi:hypothetical protein